MSHMPFCITVMTQASFMFHIMFTILNSCCLHHVLSNQLSSKFPERGRRLNNVAHSSCITVMAHAKFHVHHPEFMLSSSCASCPHFTLQVYLQISSTGNTSEVHFTSGVHIHQHHFLCNRFISFHFTDFISHTPIHPPSIHLPLHENHMHNNTAE